MTYELAKPHFLMRGRTIVLAHPNDPLALKAFNGFEVEVERCGRVAELKKALVALDYDNYPEDWAVVPLDIRTDFSEFIKKECGEGRNVSARWERKESGWREAFALKILRAIVEKDEGKN